MNDPAHLHNRKNWLQNELSIEAKEIADPSLLRGESPEEAKKVVQQEIPASTLVAMVYAGVEADHDVPMR